MFNWGDCIYLEKIEKHKQDSYWCNQKKRLFKSTKANTNYGTTSLFCSLIKEQTTKQRRLGNE